MSSNDWLVYCLISSTETTFFFLLFCDFYIYFLQFSCCSLSGLFQFFLCNLTRWIVKRQIVEYAAQKRTLAVLKGLFNVLGGLTLWEIAEVRNGNALQFHGFVIMGSKTEYWNKRSGCVCKVFVFVHACVFMLQKCPEGFALKMENLLGSLLLLPL